jgi:hyperosmotically inducible protein
MRFLVVSRVLFPALEESPLKRQISALATALLLSLAFLPSANAQSAADNTKANQANDAVTSPSADHAQNGLTDRDLMKHIRRDVVKDKSLSTYAHNVKIIAQGGRVTLRGPVHSEQEKQTVEQYARKYVGDGHVLDEITVKDEAK